MTEGSSVAVDSGRKPQGTGSHSPPPAQTLTPFGKYLLDYEIASGGMARVYLARLRGVGGFEKKLIVKQIRQELASDPRFLSLFVQEANTLVQMSHPHIVPVYELGVEAGVYYLAMEYVDGATLAELLQYRAPLDAAHALYIGERVLEALSYAHTQFGLVHRDVTPNNIMVDRVGHVRLLDFGIAVPHDDCAGGAAFGSVGYMPPEQASAEALSPASDLFALGTVLHEALVGTHPWRKASREETLEAMRTCEAPPRWEGEQLPETLLPTLTALLHPRASERPQTAEAVAKAFRAWLAAHKPEGVARELAQQVACVLATQPGNKSTATTRTPAVARPSGGTTRSLATSQTLTALLEQPEASPAAGGTTLDGTAPVTGRMSHKAPSPRLARRWPLLVAALGIAAVALPFFLAPASSPPTGAEEAGATTRSAAHPTASSPTTGEPDEATSRAPAPEPQPSRSEPAAVAPVRGTLMISATPWAEVTVDRRSLGETSRGRFPVPAGSHTVTLRCPPLGTQTTVELEVPAQGQAVLIADMSTDPPTVRRR